MADIGFGMASVRHEGGLIDDPYDYRRLNGREMPREHARRVIEEHEANGWSVHPMVRDIAAGVNHV